jgi:hypothetical protein
MEIGSSSGGGGGGGGGAVQRCAQALPVNQARISRF